MEDKTVTISNINGLVKAIQQCVRLNKPYTIIITGKGNKARVVPLLEEQLNILKLTRAGISDIFNTYVKMARGINPALIPENISCHSIRHSRILYI